MIRDILIDKTHLCFAAAPSTTNGTASRCQHSGSFIPDAPPQQRAHQSSRWGGTGTHGVGVKPWLVAAAFQRLIAASSLWKMGGQLPRRYLHATSGIFVSEFALLPVWFKEHRNCHWPRSVCRTSFRGRFSLGLRLNAVWFGIAATVAKGVGG